MNFKKTALFSMSLVGMLSLAGCAQATPKLPSQGKEITAEQAIAKLQEVKESKNAKKAGVDISKGIFELSTKNVNDKGSEDSYMLGVWDAKEKFTRMTLKSESLKFDVTLCSFIDDKNAITTLEGKIGDKQGNYYISVPTLLSGEYSVPIDNAMVECDPDYLIPLVTKAAEAIASLDESIQLICKSNGGAGSVYVEFKETDEDGSYLKSAHQFENCAPVYYGLEIHEGVNDYYTCEAKAQYGGNVSINKPDYKKFQSMLDPEVIAALSKILLVE